MAPSLCGDVHSKRSLLAVGWSLVNLLALLSFIIAFTFAIIASKNINNETNNKYYNEDEENEEEQKEQEEAVIEVTSRAMVFVTLWTMLLSTILGVFGTVLLGFQTPGGNYFWCCPNKVHTTTPLSLGVFIGALLMFANLTLICAVLFGEFQIRDYQEAEKGDEKEQQMMQNSTLSSSSLAFSIMCLFLSLLYSGFAALVFTFAENLLKENALDSRQEALTPSDNNGPGYIGGERFGVQGKNTRMNSDGFMSSVPTRSNDMI